MYISVHIGKTEFGANGIQICNADWFPVDSRGLEAQEGLL